MDFQTEPQRACYERVTPWLRELFGGTALTRDDRPVIGVAHGSAFAQVGVFPWGEDAIITTRAYVVADIDLTLDLLRFLLHENGGMHFGAFGVDDDGDIFFEHSILGSTCDKRELETSVVAVVETADRYDDRIVERWGGRRALDRPR